MRKLDKRGLIVAALAVLLVLGFGGFSPAQAATSDSSGDVTAQIIGGSDATSLDGEVSIQDNGRHRCTGSLIAPTWVLSAAHCTVFDSPTAVVRTGSLDATTGGEVVGIKRVIRHPKYDFDHVAFDLVLAELAQPVRARPVAIASIPGSDGTLGRIRGWGWLCQDDGPQCGVPAQMLQELNVVEKASLCDWGTAPDGTPGFDPNNAVCVVSADGQPRQACHGDSGGPLQLRLGGRLYVVAVIIGDGDSDTPHPHYCATSPTGEQGSAVLARIDFAWVVATIYSCDPTAAREVAATRHR